MHASSAVSLTPLADHTERYLSVDAETVSFGDSQTIARASMFGLAALLLLVSAGATIAGPPSIEEAISDALFDSTKVDIRQIEVDVTDIVCPFSSIPILMRLYETSKPFYMVSTMWDNVRTFSFFGRINSEETARIDIEFDAKGNKNCHATRWRQFL
jgi:hypothetical protein